MLRKNKKFQILFVCTGNACRSPMAEGFLKSMLPSDIKSKVNVVSAGVGTLGGSGATPFAIAAAWQDRIDIMRHRTKMVNGKLVKGSDLILCMAEEHEEVLKAEYPEAKDKIFLLKTFHRHDEVKEDSIPDPIGQGMEVYKACFDEIKAEIERILPRLNEMIYRKIY
ncbi:low molecular weight protein arginine phosphatase [candidate division KSB1 bacterium]|nr:low molecular weight protein arginine phosphatase [candidate division KSB1 bacterium]